MNRVLVVLALCACQSKSAAPSQGSEANAAPEKKADTAIDAAIVPEVQIAPPRPGAVDLGTFGTSLSSLYLHGEYVYWTRNESPTSQHVQRVRRSGGSPVEEIGVIDAPIGTFAAVDDKLFIGGSSRADAAKPAVAAVFQVIDGKLVLHATVPKRQFASRVLAYGGSLYWFAQDADGGTGEIVVTTAGSTKTLVDCPADRALCELVVGSPPLVAREGKMHRFDKNGPRPLAAKCPCNTGPVRVVDEVVLCNVWGASRACNVDVPSDHDGDTTPAPVLLSFDGRTSTDAAGIGDELQHAGAFYYHRSDSVLKRRASLSGPDEAYAPSANVFATDALGVVWLAGGHVWAAPHD